MDFVSRVSHIKREELLFRYKRKHEIKVCWGGAPKKHLPLVKSEYRKKKKLARKSIYKREYICGSRACP